MKVGFTTTLSVVVVIITDWHRLPKFPPCDTIETWTVDVNPFLSIGWVLIWHWTLCDWTPHRMSCFVCYLVIVKVYLYATNYLLCVLAVPTSAP